MHFAKWSSVCVILTWGIIGGSWGQVPQYAIFYERNDCMGSNYEYTFDTIANLTGSKAGPISFGVRGLWEYTGYMKESPLDTWTGMWEDGNGGGCLLSLTDRVFTSVTKLVNADMDQSVISFFNNSQTITEVRTPEASFASPLAVESIAFTGNKEYAIFSGGNFTGDETCLNVRDDTRFNGYGINTFRRSTYFSVGSVRLGCSGRQQTNLQANKNTNLKSTGTEIFRKTVRNEITNDLDSRKEETFVE